MKCTLPFEPCSSICVSGQTGSGKTRWVYRFLTHIRNMYSRDPPCQILYCYGIYQPLFDEMERTLKNFRSKQGVLPVVYLVYFEDSVSQSYRCLKFGSTPSPGHGSIFVRTPAERWTLFFGAGLTQWEL